MPTCRYPCIRERPCGHADLLLYGGYEQHPCHLDERPCPPCVIRVEKRCQCGKKTITVPCHIASPKCTDICGKALPCGNPGHNCRKGCHEGPCLEGPCNEVCHKRRRMCVHVCQAPCHGTAECPETPCASPVVRTCRCGLRSENDVCGAHWEAKDVDGSGGSGSGGVGVRSSLQTPLNCNEECAALDRNRRLANALGISVGSANSTSSSSASTSGDTDPASVCPFSLELLRHAWSNRPWCRSMEQDLAAFLRDSNRTVLRLPPMRAAHREFLQSLIRENYMGLTSEQIDREPYRSVVIHKRTDCGIVEPRMLVSEYLRIHGSACVEPKRLEVSRRGGGEGGL